MERLTEKLFGFVQLKACGNDFCKEACAEHDEEKSCKNCPIQKAFEKLAEYEDLDEQGLLLRLPIAEGTTVYIIDNNTDACTDGCEYFTVGYCCEDYCSMSNVEDGVYPQLSDTPVCEKQYLEVTEINPKLDWIFRNRYNFGKTVFLTKAEAEQKLKEMESD